MERNDKRSWEKDFSEFLGSENNDVPESVSRNILNQIHDELNPSAFKLFGKISAIQLVVGFVTLLFCPQFGVSITSGHGLMPYLMKFGDSVCMVGCGAVFTSLSFFTASLLLRPEEVRKIKQNEILLLASLSTLSLGALICFGGEVIFAMGFAWLFGSILGSALTLEAGWAIRKAMIRRALV
jgi:hypothetical protein